MRSGSQNDDDDDDGGDNKDDDEDDDYDDDDNSNNNNNNDSQNCRHFQLLRFPNLFLSVSLRNTLSLCSSQYLSIQASHTQTTSRLNVLRILTFVFLDKNREVKRFCADWNLSN